MSISCLLFVNNPLPRQLTIEFDGAKVAYPPKYPLEKGHDGWWDKCFANSVAALPEHHYGFVFPNYHSSYMAFIRREVPAEYAKTLALARIARAYILKVIEELGEEPLYIRLYSQHVITEEDLKDVTEVNLSDLDFTEGNEPDEFEFEIDRFYRFVRR